MTELWMKMRMIMNKSVALYQKVPFAKAIIWPFLCSQKDIFHGSASYLGHFCAVAAVQAVKLPPLVRNYQHIHQKIRSPIWGLFLCVVFYYCSSCICGSGFELSNSALYHLYWHPVSTAWILFLESHISKVRPLMNWVWISHPESISQKEMTGTIPLCC